MSGTLFRLGPGAPLEVGARSKLLQLLPPPLGGPDYNYITVLDCHFLSTIVHCRGEMSKVRGAVGALKAREPSKGVRGCAPQGNFGFS